MKNKYLIITLSFLGLFISFYLQNTKEDQVIILENNNQTSQHDLKETINSESKILRTKPNNSLMHIAQLISPTSDELLIDYWVDEYTCNDNDAFCQRSLFNAKSYEDALWLKRKGYPTQSMLALLKDVSIADLKTLSKNNNINAKNLLAIHALNNNDYKSARHYARESATSSTNLGSRETFGYLMLAQAYLVENNRNMATLYLRIASLLGDTNATYQYENLTANTAATVIDDTNRMAFGYLAQNLNQNINSWNNDPRPQE